MKKYFCFLTVILTCHCVVGQNFLIRGGLVVSSNNQDLNSSEIKSALGFTIGAGYEIPLGEALSLQPELNFIQKSFRTEGAWESSGFKISAEEVCNIHYLEIPILAKMTLNAGQTKVYISAGPTFGWGIGGKDKLKVKLADPNGGSETFSGSGNIKFSSTDKYIAIHPDDPLLGDRLDNIFRARAGALISGYETDRDIENQLDIGLQIGGGVVIGGKVFVEVRYGLGVTDLFDDATSKNRVIQFTAGIPLTFNQ